MWTANISLLTAGQEAFSRSPYPSTCLLFIQYYTVLPLYKHIIYPFVCYGHFTVCLQLLQCLSVEQHFSRTARNAGWDAHISVQNHEAARQYHCPSLHSVTAKIIKQVILFTISARYCCTAHFI